MALIASPRAKARLEAFCAPLPLRKVASEEKEYFGSVKKLDTSASSLAKANQRFLGRLGVYGVGYRYRDR